MIILTNVIVLGWMIRPLGISRARYLCCPEDSQILEALNAPKSMTGIQPRGYL